LIALRDELVQQFAFGEVIRQRFGLLRKDVLHVIALLAKFHCCDLAVAEIGELLMVQRPHEQVAVIVHRCKNGLEGGVSVLEIHRRIIEDKSR